MPQPENYLRTIYELSEKGESSTANSEVAEALDVSDASASEAIQKLEERNLVCRAPYKGITLSPPGKKQGEKLSRKYSVLVKFFEWLGVENPEKEAVEIEHAISSDATEKIEELVNR